MLTLLRRTVRKTDQRIKMMSTAAKADAFLASYPKSGRTWFRFILSHYFAQIARSGKTVDLFGMFGVVPNFDLDPVRGIPAFDYTAQRPQVPLILVTHHAYQRSLVLRRPVIFMVRDPRDVLVSAYFHATRHKHRFSGDMDAFIADREQGLPNLIAYLNGWAEGLKRHRSTVLSYESLTRDTQGASAAVIRFLGHEPSQAELKQAVDASRFGAMRELEQRSGLPAHEYDRNDTESLRMRRGVVGGFADYLNDRQAGTILDSCEKRFTPAAKSLIAKTGMILR